MKKQYLHIETPYGDHYLVDLKTGDITNQRSVTGTEVHFSRGWQFLAFRHVRRNALITLDSIRKDRGLVERTAWRFKNGHPQYTVRDRDYGTTREWGNTHVHGVAYAWIGEA